MDTRGDQLGNCSESITAKIGIKRAPLVFAPPMVAHSEVAVDQSCEVVGPAVINGDFTFKAASAVLANGD